MNNLELEKKIRRIIQELSDQKGFVCSIDVLIKLGYLSQMDLDNWRKGRITYLERVCKVNLKKLTTINQTIKQVSKKMNLKPSLTVYNKYGKGPKLRLRFSKYGNENIEKAYSTHYINSYQINKIKNKSLPIQNEEGVQQFEQQ